MQAAARVGGVIGGAHRDGVAERAAPGRVSEHLLGLLAQAVARHHPADALNQAGREATKPAATAMAPVRAKRRSADVDLAPVASTPTKAREARSDPTPAAAVKTTSSRGRPAAVATLEAAPTRVPPPSKGELRAHIEKLETANATLKAKSRKGNRAAKAATRALPHWRSRSRSSMRRRPRRWILPL